MIRIGSAGLPAVPSVASEQKWEAPVSQHLQVGRREVVLVQEHVVQRRTVRALQPRLAQDLHKEVRCFTCLDI